MKQLAIALLVLAWLCAAGAQKFEITINTDPEKIMTAEERKELGIDHWNAHQKEVFDKFIVRYAGSIVKGPTR